MEVIKRKICVFCSARNSNVPVFRSVAERCGELIGINGYDMVYGGSSRGMMGVTAKSAAKNGAKVIGVFPTPLSPEDQALYYTESANYSGPVKYETLNKNMDEAFFVRNMFERKERMFSISDVFITLPGGMGTIDEFFEVFTTKSLGWHSKEIIVVNTDNYWDRLIKLITKTVKLKFASKNCKSLFKVVDDADEAFKYMYECGINSQNGESSSI